MLVPATDRARIFVCALALATISWSCADDGPAPPADTPTPSATAAPPTRTSTLVPATFTATSAPSATATLAPTASATVHEDPTSTATPLPEPSATATESGALLQAPDPADGLQIVMRGFEVPIGGETEVCQLLYLPNEIPIDVDAFEIAMPEGSHHFVVWSYNGVNADQYPRGQFNAPACIVPRPSDSMNVAMLAGAGGPRGAAKYPDGIGFHLAAHHPVLLNAHYVNATGAPFRPTVYVNIYYAKTPVVHGLESLTAINYKIAIPPGESRTTTARFTLPLEAHFLSLSSHMHKRGDLFTARLAAGEVEQPWGRISTLEGDLDANDPGRRPAAGDFYRSPDWENPTVIVYDEPRLFRAGTVIEFSCTQHNDKSVPLGFGPLADDEMCILTGLYYRAASAPPPGTRFPGCLPQEAQLTCSAEPLPPVAPGPAICGNGRREGGEECDLGAGNGGAAPCDGACTLALASGSRLGTRRFPIVFAGPNAGTTDFVNSVTRSSSIDPGAGVVVDGDLSPDGAASLSQDAEVRIGIGNLGGAGATCIRIVPTQAAGTLRCRGGSGVDLTAEIDNRDRTAQPTDVDVGFGLGTDGGPGSALLLLFSSITTISGAPQQCLTRSWSSDPIYPLPFTTGTVTGTIVNANGVAGDNLVLSATGESFDCARWDEDDGPGILQALPFLSPNTTGAYTGDVVAQLTLAGRQHAGLPDATPTATPARTQIGGEFAALADEVFVVRCAQTSCHSSEARAGDLVLERELAFDELVGHSPDNPAAAAADLLRVAAGDPGRSFLLRKLSGTLTADEGSRMPLNNPALPEELIERIRAWIAAGAAPR